MSSTPIQLRTSRGVADVLNVSFRFARRYWRILLKSLLYLLVPPVVLGYLFFGAVGIEGMMTYMLDPQAVLAGRVEIAGGIWVGVFLSALLSFVGSALGMTAVLSVVRLHDERGPEGITFDAVLDLTKQRVLRVLGTQFGVGLAIVGGVLIVAIPCLGALVYLVGVVFATVRYIFLTIPVQVLSDETFFGSFRRTGTLAKGRFWQTAGVAVLTFVVVFMLSGVFFLPLQLLRQMGALHATGDYPAWLQTVFLVLLILSNAGSLLSVTLQSLAGAMQYYNLEQRFVGDGVEQQVERLEREAEGQDQTASVESIEEENGTEQSFSERDPRDDE